MMWPSGVVWVVVKGVVTGGRHEGEGSRAGARLKL